MSTPRDERQRAASAFTRIAASLRGSGGRSIGDADRRPDGQSARHRKRQGAGDARDVWGGLEGAATLCKTLVWLLPQAFQQLAVKVPGLRLSSRFLITSDRRGSPRPRDAIQQARFHPER